MRRRPDRQRTSPADRRRDGGVDRDETESWLDWLRGGEESDPLVRRPAPSGTGYHQNLRPSVASPPSTDEFRLVGGPRGDRRDGYQVPGRVALLDGEAGAQRLARLPVAPGSARAGNRLFILIMFWVTLAVSVELWWADTPGRSVSGPGGMLIAAGRITGLAGGFLLVAQVLMMSRVAWLEQWIGAHDLLIWHRFLGPFLVVLVPAHAVFLIFGYAAMEHASATGETWLMLRTYPAMISRITT